MLTGAASLLPSGLVDRSIITSTYRPPTSRDPNHAGQATDIRNRNLSTLEEAQWVAALSRNGATGLGVYGPAGSGTRDDYQDRPHIHADRTSRYNVPGTAFQRGSRTDNPYLSGT